MGMFLHYDRGGKRLAKKPKPQRYPRARLAALLLCLSMLTGFLPALAQAADAGEKLSSIVNFQSIALHYVGPDGQSTGAEVSDNTLIKKDDKLVLRYTYTITAAQCSNIVPNTPYYLEVSPHLVLSHLESGSPLTVKTGKETQERFGAIYADGSRAWITFELLFRGWLAIRKPMV